MQLVASRFCTFVQNIRPLRFPPGKAKPPQALLAQAFQIAACSVSPKNNDKAVVFVCSGLSAPATEKSKPSEIYQFPRPASLKNGTAVFLAYGHRYMPP